MAQEQTQEVEITKSEVTTEEIVSDITSSEETIEGLNQRLLTESKGYKSREKESRLQAQKYKEELDKLTSERVEKDGNLEERVEFHKKRADSYLKELEDANFEKVENRLLKSVREVAPDCHNINLLINNPEYESEIKAAVDVKSGEIDLDIIKSLYAKDKEKSPYLYTKTKLASQVSDSVALVEPKEKPLSKMSAEEKSKLRATLVKEKYAR